MKKFLTVLSIVLLLVALYLWYQLKQAKDELLSPIIWDSETISQLETKISELQSEIQLLKDAIPWDSEVEQSLSWNWNNSNLWDNTTNTSDNNSSTSNTTTTNWKEVWIIKQIYNDTNWNRKLEIDYVQLRWYGENGCDAPLCIVNENSKLRTFAVSDNVQIITKTLSHDNNGYNIDKTISFDYLYQIFNTNNYIEYEYLKNTPFQITIENDIIVKIEEQYVS